MVNNTNMVDVSRISIMVNYTNMVDVSRISIMVNMPLVMVNMPLVISNSKLLHMKCIYVITVLMLQLYFIIINMI